MVRFLSCPDTSENFSRAIARHSGDLSIPYRTVGQESLAVSLFTPQGFQAAQKHPLLILIHGGGWQSRKVFSDQNGWSGDYLGFLARYFADQGCLCACIDYRLMRDNGQAAGYELPDLADDCAAAVCFLRDHAAQFGIDTERMAVLGESAGGYLAAALITLPFLHAGCFRTAVLVNPITDLTDPVWQKRIPEHASHPVLQDRSPAEKAFLLSPAMHIAPSTCPTLLLHGMADRTVLPFHAVRFHDHLARCGVKTELCLLQDTVHAFLLAEYMQEKGFPLHAAAFGAERILQWLRKML